MNVLTGVRFNCCTYFSSLVLILFSFVEDGPVSPVLQQAVIPLISNPECESLVSIATITNTQICAG